MRQYPSDSCYDHEAGTSKGVKHQKWNWAPEHSALNKYHHRGSYFCDMSANANFIENAVVQKIQHKIRLSTYQRDEVG